MKKPTPRARETSLLSRSVTTGKLDWAARSNLTADRQDEVRGGSTCEGARANSNSATQEVQQQQRNAAAKAKAKAQTH